MPQCQLDTAATCNVLNFGDLSIIKQEGIPPMERGKTKLKLFHGCQKPLDVVLLQVLHGGSSHFPKF